MRQFAKPLYYWLALSWLQNQTIMKKTYHYWVYARIEATVEASAEDHKAINDAISDESVTAQNHPKVHAILTDGIGSNDIDPDDSELISLSAEN